MAKPKRPNAAEVFANLAADARPQVDDAVALSLLNGAALQPDNVEPLQRDDVVTLQRDDAATSQPDDAVTAQRGNAATPPRDDAGPAQRDDGATSKRSRAATSSRGNGATLSAAEALQSLAPKRDGVKYSVRKERSHTSIYLTPDAINLLKLIAVHERIKAHDILIEGVGLALKKRGYSLEEVNGGGA